MANENLPVLDNANADKPVCDTEQAATVGNVLILGNSGVGKSTLINAVLGGEYARTSYGTMGTTVKLETYQNSNMPLKLIDTVGFEPNLIKEAQAVNLIKKWSKSAAKEGKENNRINAIWFCVDGAAAKLFPRAVKSFLRATSIWENVPVIVVITKSFEKPAQEKNIAMVNEAFAKEKNFKRNIKAIMPVVADPYYITDDIIVPPMGINELTDLTISLLPEGIQASAKDAATYRLKQKRLMAQSLITGSAVTAFTVGAVPIPIPDGAILTPLEAADIKALAYIYDIKRDESSAELIQTLIEAGTVGAVAKTALNSLKAIPGIAVGGMILNAVVACCIVTALGEGTAYVFEQVYLGNKTVEDIDWVKKFMEGKVSNKVVKKINQIVKELPENASLDDVKRLVLKVLFSK